MAKRECGECRSKVENDFYGVLGLTKECTDLELRSAYKKLALIWHPDRCSASRNVKSVEDAKKKFQDIQEAYSVLSDSSKRFLYDAGLYDNEEDDENNQGMSDFLNEMGALMQQNKRDENVEGGDGFKNLQDLFHEMFETDIAAFSSSTTYNHTDPSSTMSSFLFQSYSETSNSNNKRSSADLNFRPSGFDPYFHNFSIEHDGRSKRRNTSQTRQCSEYSNRFFDSTF